MKSILNKVVNTGLVFLVLTTPLLSIKAHAANPIGATEITQLANNAELVALLGEEAKQLTELIKTYKLMAEQAELLPGLIQRNAAGALLNLARSTELGMAITYASASLTDDLKEAYKDMEGYEDFLKTATNDEKAKAYQETLRATLDTVESALKNAGLQADMFEEEGAAVKAMMAQMESSIGTNQILMAAGSIAAAQVEQTQKLRQLMMGQTNLIGAGVALQADQQAREEAGWKKFTTPHRKLEPFTGKRMTLREKLKRLKE